MKTRFEKQKDLWFKERKAERVTKVQFLTDGKFVVFSVNKDKRKFKRCFQFFEKIFVLKKGETGQFYEPRHLKRWDLIDWNVQTERKIISEGYVKLTLLKLVGFQGKYPVWAVQNEEGVEFLLCLTSQVFVPGGGKEGKHINQAWVKKVPSESLKPEQEVFFDKGYFRGSVVPFSEWETLL